MKKILIDWNFHIYIYLLICWITQDNLVANDINPDKIGFGVEI